MAGALLKILLRPAVRRTGKCSAGAETAGTEPEQNDCRRAAGGSTPTLRHFADAARDERAFCETEQAWSSGRQGRPSACEVKQESALVTAKANVCFPNHQFIAVGYDTVFFSYSSRLGNFILARFA